MLKMTSDFWKGVCVIISLVCVIVGCSSEKKSDAPSKSLVSDEGKDVVSLSVRIGGREDKNLGDIEQGLYVLRCELKNTTSAPVELSRAQTSCGCLAVTNIRSKVLAPMESAVCDFSFSTDLFSGRVQRSIEFYDSKNNVIAAVDISAEINPVQNFPEETFHYPVDDIRKSGSVEIPIAAFSQTLSSLSWKQSSEGKEFKITLPQLVNKHTTETMTVMFPSNVAPGDYYEAVISSNGRQLGILSMSLE